MGAKDSPPAESTISYLSSDEIAEQLGVSISTVARYRSEYAAYLRRFIPAGKSRGLLPEALEILKLIHQMKTERAHWTDIKQALDARLEEAEPVDAITGSVSLRRSLEAIYRAQQILSNETRYVLQNLQQRTEKLEKEYLRLSARLQKHLQDSAHYPNVKSGKMSEGSGIYDIKPDIKENPYPQVEPLFPDEDKNE
jgi:hypothetical protein